ncbi:MAG: lipid II flippase MurJ [bacterium]|nr:lipid II flippase MurJ [bacterium]
MMRDAWKFLTAEVRGLQKAAYVLATCAILSSILALLRDRLLASMFGASTTLDVYYAAFRIPDLIFVGIGALVSVYILIPELSRRNEGERKLYIDTIVVGFCVLAITLSIIAGLLAPQILSALFPHYVDLGLMPTLVMLTRIMLLQPILLGFSNILAAVTQIRHRYTLYAISPLVYNLGIIVGIVFLYPLFGVVGLAWGVVGGAALHAGIQIPSIVRDGFFRRIPRLSEPRVLVSTISLSLPRALTLSMNQVTMIGLIALAGGLVSGSIAVYMFAFNLQAVPLAIIGASYSVAAFPTLAAALSNGQREEFIAHVATAARYVFFWSLPATALIIVLRAHIVRVVLGSGAFDWTDTRLTAAAFAVFSLSLVAQGLTLLLVRGYYAAGRTLVPLLISFIVMVGTISSAAVLLSIPNNVTLLSIVQNILRVEDVPGSAVLVLAFAYSFIAILGTLLLVFHFERQFRGFVAQVSRAFFQSVCAACAAGISAYLILSVAGPLTFASTTASVLARGFVAGVFGIIVAALVYALVRSREWGEIVVSVRGRFAERAIPAPEVPIASSAEEANPSIPQ